MAVAVALPSPLLFCGPLASALEWVVQPPPPLAQTEVTPGADEYVPWPSHDQLPLPVYPFPDEPDEALELPPGS